MLLLSVVVVAVAADPADPAAVMNGTWRVEVMTMGGKPLPGESYKGMTLTVDGRKATLTQDGKFVSLAEVTVDAAAAPKAFDWLTVDGQEKGSAAKGVWEVDGDVMTWPKAFDWLTVDGQEKGSAAKGVWEVDGDVMTWCYAKGGRPPGLVDRPGTDDVRVVVRRAAK